MHFSSTLVLSLFAVGQVMSYPTADPDVSLVERDDGCGGDDNGNGSDTVDRLMKRAKCAQPVQCGQPGNQQAYTPQQVNSAVKNLKSNRSRGTAPGGYPHSYGANDESVLKALPPECIPGKGLTLYEFPILPNGAYSGGDPGFDRVVAAETSTTAGVARTYCLTMTHRGAPGLLFQPCITTTA
ncbi:hypothetical protein BDR22DRAFT_886545 [Usnea florida]